MRYVFVPDRLTDRSSRQSDPARCLVSARDRHLTTSCPLRREPFLPGVPPPTPWTAARGMSTRHRNAAVPALPLARTAAVRAAPHQSIDRYAPPLAPTHVLPIGFSHPIGQPILARTQPTPGRSINRGNKIRATAAPKRGMTTSVAHALGAISLATFLFAPAALPAKPAPTTRSAYTNATPPRNRCYRTGQGQMPVTGP